MDVGNSPGLGDNARSGLAACSFLKARGVLVRDVTGYGLPNFLRISIGTAGDMHSLADALAAYKNEGPDNA